ncbi:MAG: MAPEG family protein [Pseudomonadota bacterium]
MTPPVITAFYAGLNALIILWLAWSVISRRRGDRIILGDGDDAAMAKLIRGHANATETIPIALILMALTELFGAPAIAVHVAGVLLTVGRFLHGLHFKGSGSLMFRMLGMLFTLIVIGVLALGLVVHSAVAMF